MSHRFTDRLIVVTGAGSGIGRATAMRIADEGGHVIAADVDPVRLRSLADTCGKAAVATVDGDLTDPAVVGRVVAAAGERIHGLANVAGIMDGFVPPAEVDDTAWERVFSVNVTAVMRLTRAVLPDMIAAGCGAIVNVASEAALRPSVAGAAYTASKHAVVGYTGSVAFFHGPQGIRANVVASGPTITNIGGAVRSPYAARRTGPVMQATMPTPVAPERIAAAITWPLSDEDPVAKVRIWDGSTPWFITRHADQRALLNDPRLSIDEKRPGYPHMTRGRAAAAPHIPALITNTDPPEHTRLRRTVNGPFMVKRVEVLQPRIQHIFDSLVDDLLAGPRPADLVQTIGLPMPTLVIMSILGAPYADHAFFQEASYRAISHDTDPEESAKAGRSLGECLGALLAEKMTDPADDVMSEMGARVRVGEMSHADAVTMASAILIAGHETSASMISLGTLALLQNPEQLALLRDDSDDPKFVANAVEEILRYLTIVHSGIRRIAVEDVEVHGTLIKAGDGVIFDLAGANYHPEQFPEPEKLDLRRPARSHHAFGFGVHQCPGPDAGPRRAADRVRHPLPAHPDTRAGGAVRGGAVRDGGCRVWPQLAAGDVVTGPDVVVVTGTGGMGIAVARRLGSGRTEILADALREALDRAATALRDEGYAVRSVVADVSDARKVTELADVAAGEGRITAVVHLAGVSAATSTVEKIMAVDLAGPAYVIAAVAGRGTSMVCVASMAGHYATLNHSDEQALATVPGEELLSLEVLRSVGTTRSRRTSSPSAAIRSGCRLRHWRGTGSAPASTPSALASSPPRWPGPRRSRPRVST